MQSNHLNLTETLLESHQAQVAGFHHQLLDGDERGKILAFAVFETDLLSDKSRREIRAAEIADPDGSRESILQRFGYGLLGKRPVADK